MKSGIHLGQQLRTLRIKTAIRSSKSAICSVLTVLLMPTTKQTAPLPAEHPEKIADIFNVSVSTLLDNEENLPTVFDPEALTFTEFDHNLSHVYELRPEERRLVALFRLSDRQTKGKILTALSDQTQKAPHKSPKRVLPSFLLR